MKLIVKAGVRYWEDATVDGVEDINGDLIPFREGDNWCPVIDLETGSVIDWPIGLDADVHYKVCDAGEYWLEDSFGTRLKYSGDYVPDAFLCHNSARGYGDYIILKIGGDGKIAGFRKPKIESGDWSKQPTP